LGLDQNDLTDSTICEDASTSAWWVCNINDFYYYDSGSARGDIPFNIAANDNEKACTDPYGNAAFRCYLP
jgi:hypothetical protein